MKPLLYHSVKRLMLVLLSSTSFALSASIIADFPYLVVSPQNPIADKDSVTVQIMLGTASNPCIAPTFSDVSFEIVNSPYDVYPPLYYVKVKFTKDPLPKDKVCPAVYNPVDYGPVFHLGPLHMGNYRVMDTNQTYGSFSVSQNSIPYPVFSLKGKVYDDPYPMKRMSRPIPGVTVYLKSIAAVIDNASQSIIADPLPLVIDTAKTDSAGVFGFGTLRKGLYELTCVHPDFRTISTRVALVSDTSVYLTMVSIDAFAAVAGTVTVVNDDGAVKPLENCIIAVGKNSTLPIVGITGTELRSSDLITTLTDKDGKYTIDSIPISVNGEIWYVHAFKGDLYSDYQKAALYNMKTTTIDFRFALPYQNSDSIVIQGIVFRTATDKYSYRKDEPVKVRYSITNTTEQTVKFGPFSLGCEYDLIIAAIPTITTTQETELYRQSTQPIACLDAISYITVEPGQTIAKNFPDYYLPILNSFAPVRDRVMLFVSAKLRGEKYNFTEVGVAIEIRLDPTNTANKAIASVRSTVSYNTHQQRITLNLAKAQNVSIALYTLDGKMHPSASYSTHLPEGMHTLALTKLQVSKGVYIVGVKGVDFTKKLTVMQVR